MSSISELENIYGYTLPRKQSFTNKVPFNFQLKVSQLSFSKTI